jgi:hypothetical protein
MTSREQILSSKIKSLLSGLADQGAQHLTEVETDLVQTTFLLGEAIEKLGASFLAIHEAISAQQAVVDSILASAPASADAPEKLKAVQEEIAKHVNSAVTGLQFQDMTNQLLGRSMRRINGLRDALAAMGSNTSAMAPEGATEKMLEQLELIGKLLEDQSSRLERGLWKAVNQTHMESGDVELF